MNRSCRGLLLVFLHAHYSCLTYATVTCESPQYLNYEETDTVECQFHDSFFSVLWYNTTDNKDNDPVLHYQDFTKSGVGYESGEFDIYPNGSLVVNNVSLRHDTSFTVVYVHTRKEALVLLHIRVIVVVKPKLAFPSISYCGIKRGCFAEVNQSFVECSVENVRPNITLRWLARTVHGDKNITEDMSTISDGVGYTTSVVSEDVFHYSDLLTLLVCKANNLHGMLDTYESFILAQNKNINLSSRQKEVRYIERYTIMKLDCAVDDIGFFVWKKVINGDSKDQQAHAILMYSILIEEKWTQVFESNVLSGSNASLVVNSVDVENDGIYYCIYGDGLEDTLAVYEIIVTVEPVPSYPVVEGCDHQQYCVLESEYEGSLTCKLNGIRPQVQLKWNALHENDAASISFTNQHLTVKERGEVFDVTLTSFYRIIDRSRDRLTVECNVAESEKEVLYLTTKVDLLLGKDNFHLINETSLPPVSTKLTWIISIILISIILFIIISIVVVVYRKYFGKDKENKSGIKPGNKEEIPMMLPSVDLNVGPASILKQEEFLRQVKGKYRDLYDSIQPLPYIKDRLYCVNKVFVEGGIEFLESVKTFEKLHEWKSLKTYQDLFTHSRIKSTRRILEGEPGYGKSTVTLQFAYDWCNKSEGSPLEDVEILILLRLRQLGGIASIYRAIKQFILPKDTTLTEPDIENILRNGRSVVMILDGFDEYPDQENTTTSDVINIIARQMFQEFEVVTTTRSSLLPKSYPPLTKRVRLTGFDEHSRRYYIRKAVVGDDEKRVREIEQYLEGNPILSDLCQVPLLFVIFAHMTYESVKFRNLNSVTSFFRYMISCFHSHMRNKMDDENVIKYELFETDHRDLDRVAFEAFSGNTQKIVWVKEVLCKKIGQGFYDQYVRIGILVEEEVIDIIDDPGTLITEHVQYKTEVRFYHKLFCEWYAAHYISDYLQENPNVDLNEFLQHLDPFDVQYTYRFSCGMNVDSAGKIINYLKNFDGGDKFAILCILEQTGKLDLIKENIRQLCFEGVIVSAHDSLLLQRSSMQLLEIAARNDVSM